MLDTPVPGRVKVLYGEDGSRRTVDGYILSDRVDLDDDDFVAHRKGGYKATSTSGAKNRPRHVCGVARVRLRRYGVHRVRVDAKDLRLSKNCMVAMTRETTPGWQYFARDVCDVREYRYTYAGRVCGSKDVEVVDKKTGGDIRIQRRMTYSSGL